MKFAHLADCHVGGWRDPKMKGLGTRAFETAIDKCREEGVDFVLIAGDLFNSSFPGIDALKTVVKKFRELQRAHIPVYLIAGSHDFSPTGKTILDVLEEAGLCTNVCRGDIGNRTLRLDFTKDAKTGAKITGFLGKRGMLERRYYEALDTKTLEQEQGFKIFLFHTALAELKPKSLEKMQDSPISFLPKGFHYYAGGHVHIVKKADLEGYQNVVYPGPVFPNNFREMEELGGGGFYIYEDGALRYKRVKCYQVITLQLDADKKPPEQLTHELLGEIEGKPFQDAIVLIRVQGMLLSGKGSDIDFRRVYALLYAQGAYFVMRNTLGLKSPDFEEVEVQRSSVEEMEKSLIEEHAGKAEQWSLEKEKEMTRKLMRMLSSDKREGEKVYEYERRILDGVNSLLRLDI